MPAVVLTFLTGLGVVVNMLLFLNVVLFCLDSGAAIEPFTASGGVVDVFTCEFYDICFEVLGGLTTAAKFC